MDTLISAPNAPRARGQNRALQIQLLNSLDYLASECAASGLVDQGEFRAWITAAKSQRLSPACFAAYYDLVAAIEKGRRRKVSRLFKAIMSTPHMEDEITIRRLGDDYASEETRRIRRFMGSEKTGASGVRRPNSRAAKAFEETLRQAIDWIGRRAPELAAEIEASIFEIILVGPNRSGRGEFEGGTCFKLTGALVLNAEREASVADLVVTLAHEAGHAILFGECLDEMLVENPDTDLFWSPIRQSKRPLEGIFHAGFVSSRMLWVLDRMDGDSQFSLHEQIDMTTARADSSQVFAECVSIVGQNAQLTSTGARIFQQMSDDLARRGLAQPGLQAAS
ncbi:MAG: HEXXH motif-containing putative peptide modification protein [Pseudomonadota bacterium]